MKIVKYNKKIIAFLLAVFCVVGMVQVPVKAATKPVMKSVNMKWDLKNNKSVTYKTTFYQMNSKGKKLKNLEKSGKAKLSNYKITKEKDKNKLTFTVEFTYPTNYTKKMVDQINYFWMNGGENAGGTYYIALVDYETGECLSAKNSQGVKVKFDKWKYSKKTKSYKGSKKYFEFVHSLTSSCKVTVTYPKNYKNLCILVGGYSEPMGICSYKFPEKEEIIEEDDDSANAGAGDMWEINSSDDDFWAGKMDFKKADGMYSKTDKMFCHGMRVK